jgi:hypothetical protein
VAGGACEMGEGGPSRLACDISFHQRGMYWRAFREVKPTTALWRMQRMLTSSELVRCPVSCEWTGSSICVTKSPGYVRIWGSGSSGAESSPTKSGGWERTIHAPEGIGIGEGRHAAMARLGI